MSVKLSVRGAARWKGIETRTNFRVRPFKHRRLIRWLIRLDLALICFFFGARYTKTPFVWPTEAQSVPPALAISSVIDLAPTGDVGDVVAYFQAHRVQLAAEFRESDPDRVAALFAMYSVHVALPYGEAPPTTTLAAFVGLQRAHCGIQAPVPLQISRALGLEGRAARERVPACL